MFISRSGFPLSLVTPRFGSGGPQESPSFPEPPKLDENNHVDIEEAKKYFTDILKITQGKNDPDTSLTAEEKLKKDTFLQKLLDKQPDK